MADNGTVCIGNRGEGEAVVMNITPPGRFQQAANPGLTIPP